MPYVASLSGELTLDMGKFTRSLQRADKQLADFMVKSTEVNLMLNTQRQFVPALNMVKKMLREIGTTTANVELSVNGEKVAVAKMAQVEKALKDVAAAQKATASGIQSVRDPLAGDTFDKNNQRNYAAMVAAQDKVVTEQLKAREVAAKAAADAEAKGLAEVDGMLKAAQKETAAFNAELARSQKLIDGAAAAGERLGRQIETGANRAAKQQAKLNGEVEKTNGWFQKVTRTIAAFATGYLVISGAFTLFSKLKEATIDYNATLQNTRVSLTQMFQGNAKAASDLLAKLEKFAVLTPFQFGDLVQLVPQLKAANIAAKDMIPTLTALGDAASIFGTEATKHIQAMTTDLISLSARGKVTGMDIRNFGASGVNIVKYLAQAYSDVLPKGTKAAEMAVRDWIHKGLIPADQAIKAVVQGIENDPLKAGQMAKASKTFTGSIANIGDAMNKVLGQAFRPFFDSLNKMALRIADIAASDSFQRWAEDAGAKIFAAFSLIGRAIAFVMDKLPYLIGYLTVLGSTRMITGIATLGVAISKTLYGSATAAQVASARFAGWLVVVSLLIAAYRNFHPVQEGFNALVWGCD